MVAAAPSTAPARVVVDMPADAKLYVDGQRVELNARTRSFTTPQLQAGMDYFYTVKVEAEVDGQVVTESKRVIVQAGGVARANFAPQATVATAPAKDTKPATTARITVRLPADAKLYVNGQLCELTSNKRTFETPKLELGQEYAYSIKAEMVREGKKLSQDRRITFQAGKSVTVDFSNLTPLSTASTASR